MVQLYLWGGVAACVLFLVAWVRLKSAQVRRLRERAEAAEAGLETHHRIQTEMAVVERGQQREKKHDEAKLDRGDRDLLDSDW